MKKLVLVLIAACLVGGCVDAPADLYGVHRATRESKTDTTGHVAHLGEAMRVPSGNR